MIDKMKSRKLIATLAITLLVILNRKLHLDLDAGDLTIMAGSVAAYVLGQGFVDAKAAPDKVTQTTVVAAKP